MSRAGDYITAATRRLMGERAGFRCEYCLLAERDMGFSAEIDHIRSLKHSGSSDPLNLAFSFGYAIPIKAATSDLSLKQKMNYHVFIIPELIFGLNISD